jgi:Protein of unknown function (DUF2927)
VRKARSLSIAVILVSLTALIHPAAAEHPLITKNRAIERTSFTDAQISDGFFKIAFGAEFNTAGRIDRIRKYEVPVRVYADSRSKPDRRAAVAAVVADIQSRIEHIDIGMAEKKADANVAVLLVRDRDLPRFIRRFYGAERAKQIQKSLEPQCLSGFRKDDNYRILSSDVLIAVDAGEFIFYDCIYEELLQALGPINDDDSVAWTMFNDDVQKGYFDVYDQYLLNILYHPRVRAGMTRDEVRALLPEILPEIRTFVAKTNNLK